MADSDATVRGQQKYVWRTLFPTNPSPEPVHPMCVRMTTSAEVTDDGGAVVCNGTFEWSVRRTLALPRSCGPVR